MAYKKVMHYTVGYHTNIAGEKVVVALVVADDDQYIWAIHSNLNRASFINGLSSEIINEMVCNILTSAIDGAIDRYGINPHTWMPEIQGYASCVQFQNALPIVAYNQKHALEALKNSFFLD